ncbi:PAS domain S-box-containing protein [Halorubrum alkaliphilum]|uniref:PAS domain S-box-containing protein n=1 Tax=Halorubrum alkaliphilum TaxID=261290 RepID=A0A8T4GD97_9EURY|nr:PAS domain S-box protein [Halorubrum alkaliphilum]MBP1921095.1 PAS domain S-box-containing protein [Halorubrum alkaliphilum]
MNDPVHESGSDDVEGIRVLHVDDDGAFADLVATYLERLDDAFSVRSETAARDALETLGSGSFDCIVSDYDMPGMTGLELLDAVRSNDIDVPFVLFTGKGSEEIASDAIAAGATDYIQKEGGTDQYTVLANRVRNAVDQYRSKRALASSQERLSRFIEQSPLGTIEYDETFEIVRTNPAAETILGYDAEELVGETWTPFVPTDQHRTVAAVERDLLANRGGFRSVNENVTADGERIRCTWYNQVVTDDDGEVIRVFSQFEDITEREERKRRLERTNAVLSTVFDALPHGVLAEDADRRVLTVNDRLFELFGMEEIPAEAVGADCVEFARDASDRFADPEEFLTRVNAIIERGEPVRNERLALADGRGLIRTYRPIDLPDGRGHLWLYRNAEDGS